MSEQSSIPLSTRLKMREQPANHAPVMYQKWRQLLFLHWQFNASEIQRTLPAGLFVDTFEGNAYLGLVPFFMKDVRPRFLPALPCISNFQELNVRTYVHDRNGTPGVWFYSLDANQWLAVFLARTFYNLPYQHAQMSAKRSQQQGVIEYCSQRRGTAANLASHFNYHPLGQPFFAEPATLEFFLVER